MPVITLKLERFSKFVGRKVTVEEITKWLPWLCFDIEATGVDYVKVEFNPNRPDFCSYAGVARAFRGLMGIEIGLPKYEVKDGETVLKIDPVVSKVRPYMLAGLVRNMRIGDEEIADLMEMQEDLHWGIGRNRKKIAIGIHDYDKVQPPFKYTAVNPDKISFIPLDKTEKMTLREILEKHEKGMAYRNLVDWAPLYPLLLDKDDRVLSMPPIINGEITRITNQTKNLFLDITGTDYVAVERSLSILAAALSEMGGTLEKVCVEYPDHTVYSPSLTPQETNLRIDYANKALGLKLSITQVIECLRKCRLDALVSRSGVVKVSIPPYRIDILHEADLIEEVAVGYGYYRLKPTLPEVVTIGEEHPVNKTANLARQIMAGLGFIELMNFTLINESNHYEKMRTKSDTVIKLANPKSTECAILREILLPNLMKNLTDNRHESFPQLLFEVSDVGRINTRIEIPCERRLHLAAVSAHSNANFTEVKSYLEAVLRNLGLKHWEITAAKHQSFLDGRTAALFVKRKPLGILGEIHPEVLNNFELENPTSAFEIDLEEICTNFL